MCFIKNQEAFEKYLEFLVGRVQAESVVVSSPVQEFYKVLPICRVHPPCLFPGPQFFPTLLSKMELHWSKWPAPSSSPSMHIPVYPPPTCSLA